MKVIGEHILLRKLGSLDIPTMIYELENGHYCMKTESRSTRMIMLTLGEFDILRKTGEYKEPNY